MSREGEYRGMGERGGGLAGNPNFMYNLKDGSERELFVAVRSECRGLYSRARQAQSYRSRICTWRSSVSLVHSSRSGFSGAMPKVQAPAM